MAEMNWWEILLLLFVTLIYWLPYIIAGVVLYYLCLFALKMVSALLEGLR